MAPNPLYLAVFGDEHGILVRVYVASPPEPKPDNLKKLLSVLREGLVEKALAGLAQEFPQDAAILQVLRKIISLGVIQHESISGIHWSSQNGHSVHVNVIAP